MKTLSPALRQKISILTGYAERMRAIGHGEEYANNRSMFRKFHSSPAFKTFRKATRNDRFIPISKLI